MHEHDKRIVTRMGITHPDAEELITTSTAAGINSVTPDTFRMWRRLGKISPVSVTPIGTCLFRRADVEQLAHDRLERRSAGGPGEAA